MAQQYEYKVVESSLNAWSSKRSVAKQERLLAELDADGWELVSTSSLSAFVTYATLFYVRRPR
jgi:hypothetical protein